MRGLDRILELQDLDTAIDRLEHRREQLEAGEELSSLRKEMEEADARLGELRLASDSISSDSTRLEHEIASMSDKLHAEEKRMYDGSIANAKELEALQHEIASLKERRSRAEDELLEQMVRKEDVDARAAQAQTEAETARARVEEVGGDAVRELDQISADLAAKRSERGSLVPAFDEELLEQKHGVGAAAIVDGVCQACHEKLSAVELERLKRTEGVKRCEYCRRIVVLV
jgi:uncharacterized protein